MLSSADRKINVGDDFQARVEESQKDDQLLPQLSEEEREREYVSASALFCFSFLEQRPLI